MVLYAVPFCVWMMSVLTGCVIGVLTCNLGGKVIKERIYDVLDSLETKIFDVFVLAVQEMDESERGGENGLEESLEMLKLIVSEVFGENYFISAAGTTGCMGQLVLMNKKQRIPVYVEDIQILFHPATPGHENKGTIITKCVVFTPRGQKKIALSGSHLMHDPNGLELRKNQLKSVLEATKNTDYRILAGDLNFRLKLPRVEVLDCIEKQKYSKLLENDELKQFIVDDETLIGLKEGEIQFRPTYKYDEASNTYDSSIKMRTPAYTDRVLYSEASEVDRLKLLDYKPLDFFISDHRAVFALFLLDF